MPRTTVEKPLTGRIVSGRCLCGAVEIAFTFPAFWAWHDHSTASRRAHGAVYATYIGVWRKNMRIVKGEKSITAYSDEKTGATRRFCAKCGTPMIYERRSSKSMINLPRALFARTGREPRYHLAIEEMQDWAYGGEQLYPLKGYPGVFWTRPKRKKRAPLELDELPLRSTPVRRGRKPQPS